MGGQFNPLRYASLLKKNCRAESYRAFRVPADWLRTTVSLLFAAAETRLHLENLCIQNASQTWLAY